MGTYTGVNYYRVWDKETGIYKGVWRLGATQRKIPTLFRYEKVSSEMEEQYNIQRQYSQRKRAIDKQNMERYDDYLK